MKSYPQELISKQKAYVHKTKTIFEVVDGLQALAIISVYADKINAIKCV